jgi:hypothetical protein
LTQGTLGVWLSAFSPRSRSLLPPSCQAKGFLSPTSCCSACCVVLWCCCPVLCHVLWLCWPAGNKLCIVMEFAPAGDLSSFLKAAAASKLPLPEATVWQIFLQLCQGMQVRVVEMAGGTEAGRMGGMREGGRVKGGRGGGKEGQQVAQWQWMVRCKGRSCCKDAAQHWQLPQCACTMQLHPPFIWYCGAVLC